MRKQNMQEKSYKNGKSFAWYCDGWLAANSPRLKASSSAKYQTDIENHIKPYFGYEPLSLITPESVEGFTQQMLRDKKLSPKTVQNILVLFHSIFLYAKKRSGEALQELEIIYPREHKRNTRILSSQEEELLSLFLAREMDLCKFGVYIALRTGLRIGEVCALQWGDISLAARTITVRHTVQRIRSLSAEARGKTEVVMGMPKTMSSYRTIPLMPDLAKLCARFDPGNPDAYVLTGTCRCMEPRKLQRRLKEYTEECQIQEAHFHTLRHTFATRCIEAGFDVKTLSEILGHSNISVTLNQYVHPNLEQKRANMNRLKVLVRI